MKHLNTEYIEQKNFFASLPWNESVKRLPAVFHDILICQCYNKENKVRRSESTKRAKININKIRQAHNMNP